VQSTIREARLKPEYASLYPGLKPGIWLAASVIGQQLLLWHLTAPAMPPGERLMEEEHFDFRGGQRRQLTSAGPANPERHRGQGRLFLHRLEIGILVVQDGAGGKVLVHRPQLPADP
jgi:hypothetical protein